MSLFSRIAGTLETAFSFGGPLRSLIRSLVGGELEARDADDLNYVPFRVAHPLGDNDAATKLYVDQANGAVIVSGQFNGNSSLPSNTSTRSFKVVTTSGANATIGQLIFDDGSGSGTASVISTLEGRLIVVTTGLTGGTATFQADSLYVWDAQGSSWAVAGDVSGFTGALLVLRVAPPASPPTPTWCARSSK